MKNFSGFAGDDVFVRNTSSMQVSECPHAAHCCQSPIELYSFVLKRRIKRLSEFAGDDMQVSVVLVRGAGPHFSRNS